MAQQGRINFGVGFQVDKTGLNQLKQSLQEIANLTAKDITIPGLNAEQAKKELREVQQEALKLEQALQQSYNIKLGTHDGKKFNKLLEDSGTNLDQIKTKLMSAGTAGKKVWTDFSTTFTHVNKELTRTKGLIDRIGETLFNTIKWSIASSAVNAFTGTVQKAFTYVEKLDQSLNDIRIVTNKSANEMAEFAKQANKAAQGLGATTTDYTNASLIYYQQGLSDEEVSARTETTVKVANVTGQSAAEASNQLTAIWNGYKVSAEEAELYIDKVSAVAATTGADLEELSEGMGKVASAANSMGVDIDQLNASLATVITVTREDANAVGTAFKTIYARMGDLAIDGEDEFGIKLGEVSGQMKQMGVDILDTNGQMRQMGEIMEEVAGKWEGWTDAQQRAAAIALAGKRQYNNLIALFENWDMYESAKATSAGGMGTLSEQQKIYDESLEAHMNKLTTAAQGIYDSLFNSESFIEVLDLATDFLGVLEEIVDTLGGGGQVLSTIGGLLINIFSRKIAVELNNVVNKFIDWRANSQSLAESLQKFSILEELKKDTDDVTASAIKLESVATKLYSKGFISEENYRRLQATGAQMAELAKRKATVDKGVEVANNLLGEGAVDWDAISAEGGKSDAARQARDALAPEEEHLTSLIEGANKYKQVWAEFTEWRTSEAKQIPKAAETQEQLTAQKKEELALLKQQDTLDHAAINRLKAEITLSEKKARALRKQHANYLEAQEKIKTQSAGITKKDIDMLMKSKAISSQTKSNLQQALEAAQKTNATPFGGDKSGQIISAEGKAAGQAFIKAYIEALQEGKENVDAAYQAITDKKDVDAGVAEGEAAKEAAEREAARAQAIQSLTQMVGVTMQLNGVINNVFSAVNAFNASDPASGLQAIMGIGLQLIPLVTTALPLFKTIVSTIKTGFAAGAKGAQTLNAALGVVGLALAAISAVMTIVSGVIDAQEKAREAQLEHLKETRDAAKEVVEEGQKLQDLYVNYMNLLAAYEETGQGKEQLITATEELTGAYGIEISVLDELAGNYDKVALSIANYRKQKALEALAAAAEAVKADKDRLHTVKQSSSHNIAHEWGNTADNYYTVNGLEVTEQEEYDGSLWLHGMRFDTGIDAESQTDRNIAALFDAGLKDYYKDKEHNPFQTYLGNDTGLLITYTSKSGTTVESEWTSEMKAELAAAAQHAMSYAAAGKSMKGGYGANFFTKEGSDFAKAMYGWLDQMNPILSDMKTDDKDFQTAIATAAQTLISATDLTKINSAEEYTTIEKQLKEQIKQLYEQYNYDYSESELDATVKRALGSYDFLKDEAQAAAVQADMEQMGFSEKSYQNKETDKLRQIGAALGEFNITSKDQLFKETGMEKEDDALNAIVLAYQAKKGYNALAAGTLSAIKDKVLSGGDVSEDLAALKLQLPELAEQLTGFKDKSLQEQLNLLADISSKYTEAIKGVQAGGAGAFTASKLGFDDAIADFDILAGAVNKVIYPFEGFKKAMDLVDDGLVVTADQVEEFSKLVPELLRDAIVNDDGSLALSVETISDYMRDLGNALDSDEAIAELQEKIKNTTDATLRAQYTALLSSLQNFAGYMPNLWEELQEALGPLLNSLFYIDTLLASQENTLSRLETRYGRLTTLTAKLNNLAQQFTAAEAVKNTIEARNTKRIGTQQAGLTTDIEQIVLDLANQTINTPSLLEASGALGKVFKGNYTQLFNTDGTVNMDILSDLDKWIIDYNTADLGVGGENSISAKMSAWLEDLKSYNAEVMGMAAELEDAETRLVEITTSIYDVALESINAVSNAVQNANASMREFELFDSAEETIASFVNDATAANTALDKISMAINDLTKEDGAKDTKNFFELDPDAAQEEAKKYYEVYIENAQKYYDSMSGLQEEWMAKLDEQNELYATTLDYLEKVNGLLEHQLELSDLLQGDTAYAKRASILQAQIANAEKQIIIAKKAMDDAQSQYTAYVGKVGEANLDATDESYRKIAEDYAASIETWYSAVATAAQAAQDEYLNNIEVAFANFEDRLFTTMSAEDAAAEWDWVNAQNERWLDNVNAAYGIRDLERKFTKAIDQTQSVTMQQRLNQLREEELKALREKDKLTQYDLDRAAKRLEIAQAEIALQEAQANKSQMRLVRGADGAYSYQYVADTNAIAQAQENLDKLNNELYNMDKDEYLSSLSEIQDMYGQMAEEVRAILQDMSLDEETRAAKAQETITRYMDEMQALGLGTADIYSNLSSIIFDTENAVNNAFNALSRFNSTGVADLANAFAQTNIEGIEQGMLNSIAQITSNYQASLQSIFGDSATYTQVIVEAQQALTDIGTVIGNAVETVDSSKYLESLQQMYAQWIGPDGKSGISGELKEAIQGLKDIIIKQNTVDETEQSYQDTIADNTTDILWLLQDIYNVLVPLQTVEEMTSSGYWQRLTQDEKITIAKSQSQRFYDIGDASSSMDWNDILLSLTKMDTGGYTGEWGADGKIAMLHEKELVLNKTDTANILEAVDLVRNFDAQITLRLAHYMEAIDSFFKATSLEIGANDFEQNVHITAEFPNATDKNEIEEAFRDLVNLATQRAFENTRT